MTERWCPICGEVGEPVGHRCPPSPHGFDGVLAFNEGTTVQRVLDEIEGVAERLGVELLSWQRSVLASCFQVDEEGNVVPRDVYLSLPRRPGRATLLAVGRAVTEGVGPNEDDHPD